MSLRAIKGYFLRSVTLSAFWGWLMLFNCTVESYNSAWLNVFCFVRGLVFEQVVGRLRRSIIHGC